MTTRRTSDQTIVKCLSDRDLLLGVRLSKEAITEELWRRVQDPAIHPNRRRAIQAILSSSDLEESVFPFHVDIAV